MTRLHSITARQARPSPADLKLVISLAIGVLIGVIAHAQTPPLPPAPAVKKAATKSALPPKIASTSKAMKKSVAAASSRKIVLSWNQYTNVCFRIEATTNLSDWYFVTNIFPKWPTNCSFPANKKAEFFRIQTINQ